MAESNRILTHSLRYENGRICISGVINVDNFDEKEVELRLTSSSLTLRGSNFKMEDVELKSGILNMEGKIISLNYHEKMEKMSLIKRLFK